MMEIQENHGRQLNDPSGWWQNDECTT